MAAQVDPESLTWRVTPDLLGVLDASGYFRSTNPAWLRTLGFRAEEIESRRFFDFVHPDDVERTAGAFEAIQTGKPILNFENRYRRKDGDYRWLSWNAVPEGDIFFCSARDVTEAKKAAATLKTREEEARLREQFVAVLGHDLRNPIAAVVAAMRMLRREPQTDASLRYIETVEKSAQRMTGLLNDVSDLARIRLGDGLTMNLEDDCALEPIIDQAVAEVRLRHPDVLFATSLKLGGRYRADPTRVGQVVSNLVGNAAAYGRPYSDVRVDATDRGESVALSVENEGAPIPPDVLPRLFQPFARGAKTRGDEGLGLGLFISKQIAKGHGGDLTVASDERRTVFTFEIPKARAAA
ncbi:MAG: PAS domain-containing sensor histidine kinase [Pseudomonadota bacterium]